MWFRLYPETIWDRKLRRHPPSYRWVWVAILTLASESPERGKLLLETGIPTSLKDLVDAAYVNEDEVLEALLVFLDQEMLRHSEDGVLEVVNWSKRQFESDSSTGRVARHRQQRSGGDPEPPNERETPEKRSMERSRNVSETPQIQKQITDTDLKDQKHVSPPVGDDGPARIPPCPYEKLKAAWNEIMKPAGVPGISEINSNRRRWITREWAKQRSNLKTLEDFRRLFTFLAKDCSNAVGQKWFSFDWLFGEPQNFMKALEGNYHNARGGGKS